MVKEAPVGSGKVLDHEGTKWHERHETFRAVASFVELVV